MPKQFRTYIFHEATTSLCSVCLESLEAKIIFEDGKVFIKKYCKSHGEQIALLEENASIYKKQFLFSKPGTISKVQTSYSRGCPYDCGLCPYHEQHTCIGLIEITTRCNLSCPVCYASAGKGEFLPLKTIEKMMDFYQDSEFGMAELLQISGGEPTLHPHIIDILKMARDKKFKYVMLNTNGLRLAEDEDFVRFLGDFKTGFEVYLQFDGFKESTYKHFRGCNLLETKEKALKNLEKYQVPTTLVATVEAGVNEMELGEIIAFGLGRSCVRGVNFQPVTFFGRHPQKTLENRITMTGIIDRISQQSAGMLMADDFIPLPCHPERVAFTYLYKSGNSFVPITRGLDATKYLPFIQNSFTFLPEDFTNQLTGTFGNFSLMCDCFDFLKTLRPLVPLKYFSKSKSQKARYINENTFRISISSFIDAYNFESKAMRKECVHVITPDLKKIPFSAYNLIHRK